MRKTILLMLILFSTLANSKADQLAYLSKEQAQKATVFLQKQAEIIIWCACCDNEPKLLVKVSKVYFERTDDKQFYHIFLEGIDSAGKKLKEEIDLAYVHINKNGKAYCVGKKLGFKCNPCTEVFEWLD